jgi:hypothetical protein
MNAPSYLVHHKVFAEKHPALARSRLRIIKLEDPALVVEAGPHTHDPERRQVNGHARQGGELVSADRHVFYRADLAVVFRIFAVRLFGRDDREDLLFAIAPKIEQGHLTWIEGTFRYVGCVGREEPEHRLVLHPPLARRSERYKKSNACEHRPEYQTCAHHLLLSLCVRLAQSICPARGMCNEGRVYKNKKGRRGAPCTALNIDLFFAGHDSL